MLSAIEAAIRYVAATIRPRDPDDNNRMASVHPATGVGSPLATIESSDSSRFQSGTIRYVRRRAEHPHFVVRMERSRFGAEAEEEYKVYHPERLVELLCGVLAEHHSGDAQDLYRETVSECLEEAPKNYPVTQVAEAIRILRDAGDSRLSAVNNSGMRDEVRRHYQLRGMETPPAYDAGELAEALAEQLGPGAYNSKAKRREGHILQGGGCNGGYTINSFTGDVSIE